MLKKIIVFHGLLSMCIYAGNKEIFLSYPERGELETGGNYLVEINNEVVARGGSIPKRPANIVTWDQVKHALPHLFANIQSVHIRLYGSNRSGADYYFTQEDIDEFKNTGRINFVAKDNARRDGWIIEKAKSKESAQAEQKKGAIPGGVSPETVELTHHREQLKKCQDDLAAERARVRELQAKVAEYEPGA